MCVSLFFSFSLSLSLFLFSPSQMRFCLLLELYFVKFSIHEIPTFFSPSLHESHSGSLLLPERALIYLLCFFSLFPTANSKQAVGCDFNPDDPFATLTLLLLLSTIGPPLDQLVESVNDLVTLGCRAMDRKAKNGLQLRSSKKGFGVLRLTSGCGV